jgi:hypothetical protein
MPTAMATSDYLAQLTPVELADLLEDYVVVQYPVCTIQHDVVREVITRCRKEGNPFFGL